MKRKIYLLNLFLIFFISGKAQITNGIYYTQNNQKVEIKSCCANGAFELVMQDGKKLPFKNEYTESNEYYYCPDEFPKAKLVLRKDNYLELYTDDGYSVIKEYMVLGKDAQEALKIFKTINNPIGKYIDEGFSSKVHKKYVGKIVFSDEKIVRKQEDESKFIKEFKMGDVLTSRIYLPASLKNIAGVKQSSPLNCKYVISFNNKVINEIYEPFIREDRGQEIVTTLQTPFYDVENKTQISSSITQKFQELMFQIADDFKDPVDIKIELILDEKDLSPLTLATGNIKLTGINKNAFDNVIPKAGMQDAELEAKVLKAIQSHGNSEGWKEKFIKVVIFSPDWKIIRNKNTGVVIGRIIGAACIASWPDGHCTYQIFDFIQDHDGSGYQTSSIYRYGTGSQYKIPCSLAK